MHNTHPLIHNSRNLDGTVSLGQIVRTTRQNKMIPNWYKSMPMPFSVDEHLVFGEKGVIAMYDLMNEVHQDDKRKEVNSFTEEPYPFTEHTTCVGSIIANLGYRHAIVQAALGHDTKDFHKEFDLIGLIERQSEEMTYNPTTLMMIHALADHQSPRWGGETFNKLEEKENALMDKIAQLIPYPETIAVAGADRLHNLLSFDSYKKDQQRRILNETKQYMLPLLKNFDTVLYKALQEKVQELDTGLSFQLHFTDHITYDLSVRLLENFAEVRARYGIGQYLNFFNEIKNYYQEHFEERSKQIIEIQNFAASTEGPIIYAPNLPKLSDLDSEQKQNLSNLVHSTVFEANLTGKINGMNLNQFGLNQQFNAGSAFDLKFLEELYPNIAWTNGTMDILHSLMKARINKRIIENYFEILNVGNSLTGDSLYENKNKIKNFSDEGYAGEALTASGEIVNYMMFQSKKDYFEFANNLKNMFNLDDPMVILDKNFSKTECSPLMSNDSVEINLSINGPHDFNNGGIEGIRIIYEYGGIVQKARFKMENSKESGRGGVFAPVPKEKPYTIIDVVCASR